MHCHKSQRIIHFPEMISRVLLYTDSLNKYITKKESPNNELMRRNDEREREEWKAMIVDVCYGSGTLNTVTIFIFRKTS